MTTLKALKVLEEFIASQRSFQLLYSTKDNFNIRTVERLCILDSSFNPPHLAHSTLAYKSLLHDYKRREALETIPNQSTSLLLLLSVKNADKIIPAPASFDHRINMMCLMAQEISSKTDINVSVALTNHAKFVDKCDSIVEYIKSDQSAIIPKLTFLVGFDTLIRIFDAKYYKPSSIEDSLKEFMQVSELFVLKRDSNTEEQVKYVQDIQNGLAEIPSSWGSKIHLIDGDSQTLKITSSLIRKEISSNVLSWKDYVYPSILKYIEDEKLYV